MLKTTYKDKIRKLLSGTVWVECEGNRTVDGLPVQKITFDADTGEYAATTIYGDDFTISRQDALEYITERQQAEDAEKQFAENEVNWLKGYLEGLPD